MELRRLVIGWLLGLLIASALCIGITLLIPMSDAAALLLGLGTGFAFTQAAMWIALR